MKKLITAIVLSTLFVSFTKSQITTKTLPAGIRTNTTNGYVSMAGSWSGTQTNDNGQYPQAFNFQLTSGGEIIIATQNGIVAAKGTYTFTNNNFKGTYKLFSSGETISLSGIYDPSTQKLNCTLGAGTNSTGQGKLIATKNNVSQITATNTTVVPAPAPAPTKTNTQPAGSNTINANDFFLTNIIVRVYTGNDNKEALSKVQAHLFNPASTLYSAKPGLELLYSTVGGPQRNDYQDEFKVNSANELRLYTPYVTGFDGRPEYRSTCINLGYLLSTGIQLDLYYLPNFFTDAWKIEKVELQFEFKNYKGELHPVYSKSIIYPTVSTLLNSSNNYISLKTDNFLMPIIK